MKLSDLSSDYLVHWNDHMTDFWVPIIVGFIFFGLAIRAIIHRNIPQVFLYIILVCVCVGYLGFGDEMMAFANRLVH